MADRADIARRHGIEHLAHKLVGDTAEALEADAAARAALARVLTPRRLDEPQPEPPVEGLAPGDKAISEYTPDERQAQHEQTLRVLREREREAQEEQRRREAEADRTPEQAHADVVVESLRPGAKRARQAAFLRSLGLGDEDER